MQIRERQNRGRAMKKLFAALALSLMLVAPLSCDKADNNKKENSYSEQDENGNGQESGGEQTSGLSLQANWTAEVTSVGTDEYGDYVEIKVAAPGSTFLGVTILTDDDFKLLYSSDPQVVVREFENALAKNLATAPIEQCLWKAEETVYVDYDTAGPAYCWLVDFDAKGKLTGKYGKIAVTVPELVNEDIPGELKGPVSLQSNWKVTKVGEPYTVSFYDIYDVEIEVPGATFIYPDTYTKAELAEYYPGGVEEMLLDYSSGNKTELAKDPSATMADLCFSPDDDIYIQYFAAGETDVYLMDFDATGAATGKYGVTTITLPEYSGSESAGQSSFRQLLRIRTNRAAAKHQPRRVSLR